MQHTLGHFDCPACEETRKLVMLTEDVRLLPFDRAVTQWLETRRNKLAPATVHNNQEYAAPLVRFFGAMPLGEIHIGHINNYQVARQAEIRASKQHKVAKRGLPPANSDGASRINHELSVMQQLLRRLGLWEPIAKFYEPLPLPTDGPGLALEPEEESYFFEVARSRPRWLLAYCCDLLSNATAAGPKEIRMLRLQDIDHNARTLFIHERVKTKYRTRVVPCNDDAWWAVEQLLARAKKLGSVDPMHYLLPHRAKKMGEKPDPTRPMGSWKKAHYAIRAEVAKKFPRLARLRKYDFRHNATTRLLENPLISERTIEEFIGHRLGSKTKERYSHIRMEARRAAADALNTGHVVTRRPPMRAAAAAAVAATPTVIEEAAG